MAKFLDFGRFSEMTEDKIEEDKERFLMYLGNICGLAWFPIDKENINEEYLNNIMKKYIKRVDFPYFMIPFGISYDYLDKEEKEEFRNLYFSYENVKSFTINYQQKYIKKCQNILDKKISECFQDICFIIYCHIYGNPNIEMKIFIRNIRDYFILDKEKDSFVELRNESLFNTIRSKMLDIYPTLKNNYCKMNSTIEKLLSYIDWDNDYHYKILRDILNNNLNKEDKEEEYIKLKEKTD